MAQFILFYSVQGGVFVKLSTVGKITVLMAQFISIYSTQDVF